MQSSLMRRRLGQRAAYESLRIMKPLVMTTAMTKDECGDGEPPGLLEERFRLRLSQNCPCFSFFRLNKVVAERFTQDQMITWEKFVSVMITVEKKFVKEQKPSIRWFRGHPKVVMFQKLICHRYFSYLGNVIALVYVVLIAIEVGDDCNRAILRIVNFIFIIYYTVEQILLLVCMGWRRFRYHTSNLLDLIFVFLLCISQAVTVCLYGFPFFSDTSDQSNLNLWNMVRIINILIMVRLLRIIWQIKNFIMKWDRYYEQISETQSSARERTSSNSISLNTLTLHDIFRPSLKEPAEVEILSEPKKLTFFNAGPT